MSLGGEYDWEKAAEEDGENEYKAGREVNWEPIESEE